MGYDNTDSGTLSPNDKGDNPKRPDWKGKLNVGGRDYDLAAWKRTGPRGEFLSLKVSEPRDGGRRQEREADSDSPF